MTRGLAVSCAAGSAALLAGAFLAQGRWQAGLAVLALGGAWVYGMLRRLGWMSWVGLAAVVLAAAAGWITAADFGLPETARSAPALFFAATLLALAAWDLAGFDSLLRQSAPQDDRPGFARLHFIRLAAVIGLGTALAFAGLHLELELPFGLALGALLFSVWGIARVIRDLIRKE